MNVFVERDGFSFSIDSSVKLQVLAHRVIVPLCGDSNMLLSFSSNTCAEEFYRYVMMEYCKGTKELRIEDLVSFDLPFS